MDIQKLKAAQKLLAEWSYDWHPIERGYNNRTLYINVGSNEVKEKPVSQEMKDKFVGGKGFGLRLLWDATTPTTKWDDPENEIIISPGPIGGITQYSGAGKSLLVKSTLKIQNFPLIGKREELLIDRKFEYRFLVVGKYKVIYWIEDNYIKIATIFDCRQNPEKLKKL